MNSFNTGVKHTGLVSLIKVDDAVIASGYNIVREYRIDHDKNIIVCSDDEALTLVALVFTTEGIYD